MVFYLLDFCVLQEKCCVLQKLFYGIEKGWELVYVFAELFVVLALSVRFQKFYDK